MYQDPRLIKKHEVKIRLDDDIAELLLEVKKDLERIIAAQGSAKASYGLISVLRLSVQTVATSKFKRRKAMGGPKALQA